MVGFFARKQYVDPATIRMIICMPAILHDKFYTPGPIVRKCVGALWRVLGMTLDDLFVEPSAGAGAFCRHLPQDRLMALDIAPEAEGITSSDFLVFEPPAHEGRIVVIGNPPFGRNGAMARAFLRHAMGFADIVAFILPASFAKSSMQRSIDKRFHLVHEAPLGDQHFETSDGDRVVNTVFQIWQKRDVLRHVEPGPVAHGDFAFVTEIHDADLIIRRVGGRAGAVLQRPVITEDGTLPPGYSRSSNYFIKAVGCDPVTLEERLRSLNLSRPAGTAVYPSLSKRELVGAYVEAEEPEVAVRVKARSHQKARLMDASEKRGLGDGCIDVITGRPEDRVALIGSAYPRGLYLEVAPPRSRSPKRGLALQNAGILVAGFPRNPCPAPGAAVQSTSEAIFSEVASQQRRTSKGSHRSIVGSGALSVSRQCKLNDMPVTPVPLLGSQLRPAPHVGHPTGDPEAYRGRERDHLPSTIDSSRANASGSTDEAQTSAVDPSERSRVGPRGSVAAATGHEGPAPSSPTRRQRRLPIRIRRFDSFTGRCCRTPAYSGIHAPTLVG